MNHFVVKIISQVKPIRWRAIRRVLCLPLLIASTFFSGCALLGANTPQWHQTVRSAESRRLHEIFESFFDAELALFPTFATEIGDHRYDDQLEIAISEGHLDAHRRLLQQTLERLAEIKRDEISAQGRLYFDVLSRNLRRRLMDSLSSNNYFRSASSQASPSNFRCSGPALAFIRSEP